MMAAPFCMENSFLLVVTCWQKSCDVDAPLHGEWRSLCTWWSPAAAARIAPHSSHCRNSPPLLDDRSTMASSLNCLHSHHPQSLDGHCCLHPETSTPTLSLTDSHLLYCILSSRTPPISFLLFIRIPSLKFSILTRSVTCLSRLFVCKPVTFIGKFTIKKLQGWYLGASLSHSFRL